MKSWGTKSCCSQTHSLSTGTVLVNSDRSKAQPNLQPTIALSFAAKVEGQLSPDRPNHIWVSFQNDSSFSENCFGIDILQLLGARIPSAEISFGRKQFLHSSILNRLKRLKYDWSKNWSQIFSDSVSDLFIRENTCSRVSIFDQSCRYWWNNVYKMIILINREPQLIILIYSYLIYCFLVNCILIYHFLIYYCLIYCFFSNHISINCVLINHIFYQSYFEQSYFDQ